MGSPFKHAAIAATVAASALCFSTVSVAANTVKIALGDVASVETLAMLVGLERAKEKGLNYELTAFSKEELAIQAIIGGQMDVGIGTPYSVIQKSKVPLRNFFQLSKLVFYPVAANRYKSWNDMQGEPITLHSRGGGTDAIANIIEKRENVKFGKRSYVPGSENRIIAMMKGQVDASIVDLSNKNILMKKAGEKFGVLPMFKVLASDEVLFANSEWMSKNKADVAILVEALLSVWQDMSDDPTVIDRERVKYNLLSDLPSELLTEVDAYYKEAVDGGLFARNGGGREGALADFEFYSEAGQLTGDINDLRVNDFWDLKPLNAAIAKAGK